MQEKEDIRKLAAEHQSLLDQLQTLKIQLQETKLKNEFGQAKVIEKETEVQEVMKRHAEMEELVSQKEAIFEKAKENCKIFNLNFKLQIN